MSDFVCISLKTYSLFIKYFVKFDNAQNTFKLKYIRQYFIHGQYLSNTYTFQLISTSNIRFFFNIKSCELTLDKCDELTATELNLIENCSQLYHLTQIFVYLHFSRKTEYSKIKQIGLDFSDWELIGCECKLNNSNCLLGIN